jgi:diadenosine tetraphosphate (Ap4A) HIT family hydrolase
MLYVDACASCRTLKGQTIPAGGIVHENAHWMFFLRETPLFVAGQGFIVLKRHCERVSELADDEASSLGWMMRDVERGLNAVLKPAKVHFGLYAEQVRHIHFHVTPRMPDMPAGNIPLVWLGQWREAQTRLKLRRPIAHSDVERVAQQLREVISA